MHVCFTRGFSLAALLVRLDTCRPGQPLEDTPAHVSVVIGETLYEMVSSGWHLRPALPSDLVWSVELTGLDEEKALAAALCFHRMRYGWWVDLLIGLCRYVPNRWLSCTRGAQKPICSAFVKAVLEAAGWPCPHWLAGQFVPESPNDLWWAVRPRVS